MKKLLDNKIVQLGLTAFGVIAACILFGFCLFHVSKILSFFGMLVRILMPLIYGLVLAYIMHPLVNLFERKVFNKINKLLELPEEVITDKPKLTIVGFEEVLIENYKAILEYEDYYIKINTHIGAININGFNLRLKEMTGDDIMVLGSIDSMDFEQITDE